MLELGYREAVKIQVPEEFYKSLSRVYGASDPNSGTAYFLKSHSVPGRPLLLKA
jgi:hypothetical protein